MSPDAERRPGKGGAQSEAADGGFPAIVPDAADVAAALAEAGRIFREKASALALAGWHARGEYGRGWRAGYEAAYAEMAAEWAAVADPVARGGPSHAELELRRWGPGGRERFGDPRPGDYPGRGAA